MWFLRWASHDVSHAVGVQIELGKLDLKSNPLSPLGVCKYPNTANVGDSLQVLRVFTYKDLRTRARIFGLKNALWWFWPDLAIQRKTDKAKTAKKGHFWVCPDSARILPKNHSQQLMKTEHCKSIKMMLFIRAIGDKEVIAARKKPTFLILLQ